MAEEDGPMAIGDGIQLIQSHSTGTSTAPSSNSTRRFRGQDGPIRIQGERFFLFDSSPPDPERIPQKGQYITLGNDWWKWKWSWSGRYMYLPATVQPGNAVLHKDAMGRVNCIKMADAFPDPEKASLEILLVQAADSICAGEPEHASRTYRRTYIRPQGAFAVRAAAWPFAKLPVNRDHWTEDNGMALAWRWPVACIVAALTLPLARIDSQERVGGMYRRFPYRLWTYPWAARDRKENFLTNNTDIADFDFLDPSTERILRPRYLVYINNHDVRDRLLGSQTVARTEEAPQANEADQYVFVAWTGTQFDKRSPEDMKALDLVGEMAARRAGVPAYWVSSVCIRGEQEEEDIYRISDVIRGAHSLAIAVGNPSVAYAPQREREELLKEWGSRIWTLPEALLSAPNKDITVYVRQNRELRFAHPWSIPRADFPVMAWDDANIARELMDHYAGNLKLSSMELVVIALKCLQKSRRFTDEGERPGDRSYVLMGLLRRRPKPCLQDTAFQAFARLSLENYNEKLLERMICMQTTAFDDRDGIWMASEDVWGCSLWDIYPLSQVAGIGDGDSVILDGCYAAAIKWDCFVPVAQITGFSWRRFFKRLWLRICPLLFIIGVTLLSTSTPGSIWTSPLDGELAILKESVGAVFIVLSTITILTYPLLIRQIHGGKVWHSQAELFGFEGHLDIASIEALIWGHNLNRLQWSVCGSSLSRHSWSKRLINGKLRERIGRDPADDQDIRTRLDNARTRLGSKRIFTIVDTNIQQVTLIEADNPPVVALIAGKEGGMVRALLCSYDYRTNTVYREAVMRMESPVIRRMEQIGSISLGLRRPAVAEDDNIGMGDGKDSLGYGVGAIV